METCRDQSGNPGSCHTRPFLLPIDRTEKIKFVLKVTIKNGIKAFNVELNKPSVSFHCFESCFNHFRPILGDLHFEEVSSGGEKVNKNVNKAFWGFEKLQGIITM